MHFAIVFDVLIKSAVELSIQLDIDIEVSVLKSENWFSSSADP
jgi:hypothetical protein